MIFWTLISLQMKAEVTMTFNPDSLPAPFAELKENQRNAERYLSLWNKMKKEIDAQKGDNTVELYYLYRDRTDFHYDHNEVDSLKKYSPIFRELCLKLNDEYHYYRSWDLLCETMLFSNDMSQETAEHQKMHQDALERKSEIGMAYSTSRIGMGYASRKEYQKALPYLKQAMASFKNMKSWNEYITIASNSIILLTKLERREEAIQAFVELDSLANSFIHSGDIATNASRILMIKDIAADLYDEPKDTAILRKYLQEIEAVYRVAPHEPRNYLYNTKTRYATLRNNLSEKIAYQDSSARFYQQHNNIINLTSIYNGLSKSLYEAKRFQEAYLTLRKHTNLNDSLHKEDFLHQLSEISTRYNMSKLELDAQKARMEKRNMQYYYACIIILILVAALVIGIKFYLHKVKSNRILQQQARALAQANEKAYKAQLMKTAFIQNMNHEVRTPLNAIVGFSECLSEIPMGPEEIKEITDIIKKNSDSLLKIISDMITIANYDSEEPTLTNQPIDIEELCSGLIPEMQEYAAQGVKLYYTQGQHGSVIESNKDIIHQILVNLLHNALKFTQSGEVELSCRIDDKLNTVYFYVRDTGPGIASELKEKVFERFYKVDSFIPGAGLGLSLCRVLSERLGAQVYLDDSYRQGCLFVFAHPLKNK